MLKYQGMSYDTPIEGVVKIPLGIFETDDGSKPDTVAKIGTIRRLGDRTFIYAKNGGSILAQGLLAVQPTPAANHQNVAVQTAVTVGENTVTVGLGATAATKNQYLDGYLVISDATGEGTCYKIKSNPAADSSGTLQLTLYDTIHEALDTTSECCLIPNPYNGVVIAVTDQADVPAGIPINAIPADEYFWIQTGGTCPALADENVTQGESLVAGTSVAGSVEADDAAGEPVIGLAVIALVDTEYRPIYLQIRE